MPGRSTSKDLSYVYVWPDEFASEAEFLAHVLRQVREGMESKKNQGGDPQLRVLRAGFVEEKAAPDEPARRPGPRSNL